MTTEPSTMSPASLRDGLALKQLPALDGIRAVAAFLVVFYHFGSPLIPGGLGVLIFFVLSGFLITWLLLAEHDQYGEVSLRLFYIRRSLRIFPAFYAYWILIGSWLVFTHRIIWPQALSSLFYVNNYYQALQGDPNTAFSHTWSLGVEEQFYLLWPAAFIFLRRRSRPATIPILIAAIVIIWAYRAFLHFVVGVSQGYIYEAFDTRADHLLIGCLLAFILYQGAFSTFWTALTASIGWSLLTLALLVGSVVLSLRGTTYYRNTVGFMIDPLVVALLIPQLIAFRDHVLWSWLNWRPIRFLGRISYSVYLYQQLTPALVEKFLPGVSYPVQVAANALLVTVVASTSFYFIERPFLTLKNRFSRARQHAAQLSA